MIQGRALSNEGRPGPPTALALQPTYGNNWAPWCPGDTRSFPLSWACEVCPSTWARHTLFDLEFPSLVFYAFYSSPKWLSLLQYSSSQKYVSMMVEHGQNTMTYRFSNAMSSLCHMRASSWSPWLVRLLQQSHLVLWLLNLRCRGYVKKTMEKN